MNMFNRGCPVGGAWYRLQTTVYFTIWNHAAQTRHKTQNMLLRNDIAQLIHPRMLFNEIVRKINDGQ